MSRENKVTRFDIEGKLLDVQAELREFPLMSIMREDGIPESVIMQIDLIGQAVEVAIQRLQERDAS